MRWVFTFMCVFALGLMGCSEASGTGGNGGEGNCWLGAAGGDGQLQPGLHESYEDDPNKACFYVNESCTGLAPSLECDAGGGDGREPQFTGVEWVNGVITMAPNPEAIGESCAGALAVTADMAPTIPIGKSDFIFTWTDEDGALWELRGDYETSQAYMRASRRDPDGTVCAAGEPPRHWIPTGPY